MANDTPTMTALADTSQPARGHHHLPPDRTRPVPSQPLHLQAGRGPHPRLRIQLA